MSGDTYTIPIEDCDAKKQAEVHRSLIKAFQKTVDLFANIYRKKDPATLEVLVLGKKYDFSDAMAQLNTTVYGLNLRYRAKTKDGEWESVYLPSIILETLLDNRFLLDYVKAEAYNWERRKLQLEQIYLKQFNNYRPPDPSLGAVTGILSEMVQLKSKDYANSPMKDCNNVIYFPG